MRAEEIIIGIYQEKLKRQNSGQSTQQVVMNMKDYRTIQEYHRQLGKLEGDLPDYISRDSVFGLDILIDNKEETSVS